MPDFLSIPGNIRQQYMPFTIAGPGERQVFSFKDYKGDNRPTSIKIPSLQIHPFSDAFKQLIQNDSSIKYTHRPAGSGVISYEDFLNEIPAIQIREYVPDAKLTQTFKWFSYFKKGFDAALQNVNGKTYGFSDIMKDMKNVMEKISDTMKDLTSGNAPLLSKVVGGLVEYYIDKGYNIGTDNGYAVLFLPFIMYYRLTTLHTNNIYEIPYSMQNDIMHSDGTYGWTSSQSDFGLLDKAGTVVAENPFVKALLGNTIKVNMMPSFQPSGETKGQTFSITIDLINDTDEAAANNFLMCHTLFGNNRWMQYGFVQTGASLYDVKLPGANRYFACTGSFVCKGKGAFRTPSSGVIERLLLKKNSENTFAKKLNEKPAGEGKTLRETLIDVETQRQVNERIDNVKLEDGTDGDIIEDTVESFEEDIATLEQDEGDRQLQMLVRNGIQQAHDAGFSGYGIPETSVKYFPQSISKEQAEQDNKRGVIYKEQIEDFKNAQKELTQAQGKVDRAKEASDNAKNRVQEAQEAYNKESSPENEQRLKDAEDDLKTANAALDEATAKLKTAEANYNKARAPLEVAFAADIRQSGSAEKVLEKYENASKVTETDLKKLIKIPDVYSLTLTFNSLIPDNFNNYLYGYRAANLDPIEDYANETVNETGVFEKLAQQIEMAIKGSSNGQ